MPLPPKLFVEAEKSKTNNFALFNLILTSFPNKLSSNA
jgi:hypothetical protein